MKNQLSVDVVDNSFPKTVALIGTSCAGKTTAAYSLVGRLKSYGVLADGAFSQDRKFSFPVDRIASEAAQAWMVTNLIAKVSELGLHSDVDLLVMDRSPLCLMAYYHYQYPDSPKMKALLQYVIEWMKSLDLIIYLPPLPYQDDSKRPDDSFRLEVDRRLQVLCDESKLPIVKVLDEMDRHTILEKVLMQFNISKPGVKTKVTRKDVQSAANYLDQPIYMKDPSDKDMFSDTDLWVVLEPGQPVGLKPQVVKQYLRAHAGPYVRVDVNFTNDITCLPEGTLFKPEQA